MSVSLWCTWKRANLVFKVLSVAIASAQHNICIGTMVGHTGYTEVRYDYLAKGGNPK